MKGGGIGTKQKGNQDIEVKLSEGAEGGGLGPRLKEEAK